MTGQMKWKIAVVVTVGTTATVAGVLYLLRNAQARNMSE